MALRLTVQASRVKAHEWQTGQGSSLSGMWMHSNEGLDLRLSTAAHKYQNLTIKAASLESSATQAPENGITNRSQDQAKVEERKWQQFFEDPSMWWDNRKTKRNSDYPDFKHVYTGEGLWIDSRFCPIWVSCKLKEHSPALGRCMRAQYRKAEGLGLTKSYGENAVHKKLPRPDNTNCGQDRETLRIYDKMREKGLRPSINIVLAGLKVCSSLRDLQTGKKIHVDVTESEDDSDIYVAAALVNMYAKCGSMVDARRVFERMPHHDVVSWNAIIRGYAQSGEGRLALQLFARMQDEGCAPTRVTFLAALKACGSLAGEEVGNPVQGKLVKLVCLEKGKAIHLQVAKSGHELDIYVGNTLVDMYAKCRSMADARWVFDRMSQHNVVSWTTIILGYVHSGEAELALQLYARMQDEGCAPAARTFVAALKACASLAAEEEATQIEGKFVKPVCLEKGIGIHSQAAKNGHESDDFVAATLVDMYAKCGSMLDARRVFDRIPHHNVVSWTAMILGYAHSGDGEMALRLYARMQDEGCVPDAVTFVAALKACGSLAAEEEGMQVEAKSTKLACLEQGKAIHSQVAKSGHDSDIFVASTLVDMYVKCGSMVDARQVFDRIPYHNVVSWTAMIFGYAQSGQGELALQLYARMQDEGCTPNAVTFVAAMKACGSLATEEDGKQVDGKLVKVVCLEKGKAIHSQVAKSGHELKIYVANTVVDMYAKCGSMLDAQRVFDRMVHRSVVSWNAIILGYAQSGEGELALQLYVHMQDEGCTPDRFTFVAALKACVALAAQEEGKQVDGKLLKLGCLAKGIAIHSQVAKSGHDLDMFVAATLVDMYAKCGSMPDACGVFERIPHPDVVSWTAIILGHAQSGEGELALQLFERMQAEGCAPDRVTFVAALKACVSLAAEEEGKQVEGKLVKIGCLGKGKAIHSQVAKRGHELDIFVANTLVDMYAKCGSMVDAHGVFERMPHRSVVSWTAVILGYAQSGEGELALEIFGRMQDEGCEPNRVTFVAALKACGSLAALETGERIQVEICRAGFKNDPVIANCLVDFYGKCGSMVDAQQVFDSITTKDLVTWNALIAGYSRQGDTQRVFYLFERMQEERVQADAITFLSILTVCSHAGLVDKGKEYFEAMCSDYVITPGIEHYTCMVDLLARANHLDDAVAMVKNMHFEPNMRIWTTLLGACRKWKNVAVGRLAFESILRLDGKEAAAYVLMANTYASAGMWEESAKIQTMRRNTQAWKKPGQSWWVDKAGLVHTFVAGDTSHPQREDMQAKLKDVLIRMKEDGYVPDLDSVFRNISDDEKESALCGHSERLAIACALINTAPGTTIRIVKNLRVCDDCHKATAVISKIEQRAIVCRDASRFHFFKDGKCSCGDFW